MGQPARARNAFAVIAGVGVAIDAVFALTGTRSALVDDWLYCGLFLLAAAGCAHRARRGDASAAWIVATVGVLFWGAAEIVYRVQVSDLSAWYPRSSQLLLFIAFSLAYATLGLLARERVRHFDAVLALDGLLTGLAAAAIAALLLFPALGRRPIHGPAAPPVVFLIAALVGLMFVVTVLGMTGWRPGPSWALIATAIAINVGGDAVLVHLTDTGRYHRGSPADTLFVISALLLGLAGFCPSRYATAPQDTVRRLSMPLVSALAALGVLIAAIAHGAGSLAAGLAAASLAVMIARMTIALELVERNRRLALADDLTGLGNRRRLVRDLDRRLTSGRQEVFVLALYDLDGFKRYNDTFGHASGDALLVRLAGRLATAVAPGSAYRMGGDEFCAIVEDDGAGAALARAELALSEQGDVFSITSSSGAVALPVEATDASAALRIADSRMYLRKAGRTLAQTQTRDAMLKMLSERDPSLRHHMEEVAKLAARVGRRLELDQETCDQVERAAELHDIGKIALPDAILHKPTGLDDEEWRYMRQHPVIAERILRAAPSLAPIAPLVRSSQERWDGQGYPDGLGGDLSPLGARIIAVCDAYQAIRSGHPYRDARTQSEALDELRRCSGTQFDPTIVEALCQELTAAVPP